MSRNNAGHARVRSSIHTGIRNPTRDMNAQTTRTRARDIISRDILDISMNGQGPHALGKPVSQPLRHVCYRLHLRVNSETMRKTSKQCYFSPPYPWAGGVACHWRDMHICMQLWFSPLSHAGYSTYPGTVRVSRYSVSTFCCLLDPKLWIVWCAVTGPAHRFLNQTPVLAYTTTEQDVRSTAAALGVYGKSNPCVARLSVRSEIWGTDHALVSIISSVVGYLWNHAHSFSGVRILA